MDPLEASELHGNRGHETEAVKAFLSRQVDGPVRLAYGRLPVSVPWQFVLIGTTNANIGYLEDATGGRRFWPVHVQRFDVDAIRRDRDQLWAEAVAREDAGASIRLSDKLWAAAALQQEQRRAADPGEDLLEQVLEGPDKAELDGDKAEVVRVADICNGRALRLATVITATRIESPPSSSGTGSRPSASSRRAPVGTPPGIGCAFQAFQATVQRAP